LLLALAHTIDAKLACALQQVAVHDADPMQLLVRPSLVVGALSERPALLHRKEPTLAAMVAVCSPWMHESVACAVDGSHEQCLLAPCQQHCSDAAVRAALRFSGIDFVHLRVRFVAGCASLGADRFIVCRCGLPCRLQIAVLALLQTWRESVTL
jgi:hypothetical protein